MMSMPSRPLNLNAPDYLLKPIDTERLRDAISRVEDNQTLPENGEAQETERLEKILASTIQVL